MKRIIIVLIAFIFISVVHSSGYAQQSTSHEKYSIVIYSFPVGGASYVLCFALADMINKYSKWLTAVSVETAGPVENMKVAIKKGNIKTSIFHTNMTAWYEARDGVTPFEGNPHTWALVAREFNFLVEMVTLDPDIKSFKDLAGKRVSLFHKGSASEAVGRAAMQLYGVYDKAKIHYLSYDKAKDALLDGTLDAAFQTLVASAPKFLASPATDELMSAKKVYCVNIPLEDEQKLQKMVGWPFSLETVPKSADPRMQNDWVVISGANAWACDFSVPDDVVYEIVRILNEHMEEFKTYHASALEWTPEGFVKVLAERKYFHPGALKYYDEQGIKITFKEDKN